MHPTMRNRQLRTSGQEKPKAEWVDSGLPKVPVNHDRVRMAALDPDANAEVVGMFNIGERQ